MKKESGVISNINVEIFNSKKQSYGFNDISRGDLEP